MATSDREAPTFDNRRHAAVEVETEASSSSSGAAMIDNSQRALMADGTMEPSLKKEAVGPFQI